jgi:hypothetical protein
LRALKMSTLHMTPLGYTNRRPAGLPSIDRAVLMRCAHQVAKRMRPNFGTYREALAYGLRAAWGQAKVAQTFRSLRDQVAPVQHSASQIEASRQATRRTGSSLWAS